MTRAALLALLLLAAGCTQLYADRVVLVTPQTYLRAGQVDAQGVAFVASSLHADELHGQAWAESVTLDHAEAVHHHNTVEGGGSLTLQTITGSGR